MRRPLWENFLVNLHFHTIYTAIGTAVDVFVLFYGKRKADRTESDRRRQPQGSVSLSSVSQFRQNTFVMPLNPYRDITVFNPWLCPLWCNPVPRKVILLVVQVRIEQQGLACFISSIPQSLCPVLSPANLRIRRSDLAVLLDIIHNGKSF